jgi:hypothetical protein
MKSLCKYKDILGKPNKGAHKTMFGIPALVDWILTVFLALIMAGITFGVDKELKNENSLEYWKLFLIWFFSLFIFAMFLHYIFCVKTRLLVFLGIMTPPGFLWAGS